MNLLKGQGNQYIFLPFFTLKKENPYIRMTCTFWRAVRQYRLGTCSRKRQDITYFLLKYFKRVSKKTFWWDECPKWYVSESAFQRIKRQSGFYFFFPHSLLSPKSYNFLYSLIQFKEFSGNSFNHRNHFSAGIFTYHPGSLPGYPVGCPSIGGILKLLFDNSFDFCGQSFLTGNKYHCGKRNLVESGGVKKKVIIQ